MSVLGRTIHLEVSGLLSQAEWGPVYEEALRLACALPLADRRTVDIHGSKICCLVPVRERREKLAWPKNRVRQGFRTCGDYEYMRTAGTFYLPGHVEDIHRMEHGCDAEDASGKFYILWQGFTMGEPYHIYLLALACLIEDRLKDRVRVYGRFTKEEYQEAANLANDNHHDIAEYRYDRTDYFDLIRYKVGDSIHPNLLSAMKESAAHLRELLEADEYQSEYEDLMKRSGRERFAWLADKGRHILIRDRDWENIFNNIDMHMEAFSRYYPLVKTHLGNSGHIDFVKGLMTNDELYECCMNLI